MPIQPFCFSPPTFLFSHPLKAGQGHAARSKKDGVMGVREWGTSLYWRQHRSQVSCMPMGQPGFSALLYGKTMVFIA
jgi:hypothetical protein